MNPGNKGPDGDKGLPGNPGRQGRQGNQGNRGNPGERGHVGDKPPASKGKPGDKGIRGDRGRTGSMRSIIWIVVLLAVIPGLLLSVATDVSRYQDARQLCDSANVTRDVIYNAVVEARDGRLADAKKATDPKVRTTELSHAAAFGAEADRLLDAVSEFPLKDGPVFEDCSRSVTKVFPFNLFQ